MITLIAETLTGVFTPPFRRKEFFQQLHFVGNKSLFIVVFLCVFCRDCHDSGVFFPYEDGHSE
ncbi:hypothetical protein [Bdellovibrio bacteriovorus]|uniref:hypothetical protein n=1 Tax=Bdellovibrio bacteriovorus TaxID=959 RepID=UPI0035A7360C